MGIENLLFLAKMAAGGAQGFGDQSRGLGHVLRFLDLAQQSLQLLVLGAHLGNGPDIPSQVRFEGGKEQLFLSRRVGFDHRRQHRRRAPDLGHGSFDGGYFLDLI